MARGAVLQQLREHLRRNLVRFGRTWNCQARGIPQASGAPFLLLFRLPNLAGVLG